MELNAKYIFIGFCLVVYTTCNNHSNNIEAELSCESISRLMDRDQKLRATQLKDPFFANVDSLIKINGFPRGLEELSTLPGDLEDKIWKEAKINIKPFSAIQKSKKDSLWKIQRNIDSLNTLEVLRQISIFGIDSLNRIDALCDQNSLFVFVHTPEGLMSKVSEVVNINKEKIGENRMRHIGWHLNGRE